MLCWQWYTWNKCLVVPIRWWAWSWDNVCALWPVNSGENTGAFITWMTSGGREVEVGEGLKFQNSELDYSFEHWTSVKGGAHSRFADTLDIPTSGKSVYEPHPQEKFSGTTFQTQQCNWNMQQSHLRFLQGTVTYRRSGNFHVKNNSHEKFSCC